jgi:hypothetical protein
MWANSMPTASRARAASDLWGGHPWRGRGRIWGPAPEDSHASAPPRNSWHGARRGRTRGAFLPPGLPASRRPPRGNPCQKRLGEAGGPRVLFLPHSIPHEVGQRPHQEQGPCRGAFALQAGQGVCLSFPRPAGQPLATAGGFLPEALGGGGPASVCFFCHTPSLTRSGRGMSSTPLESQKNGRYFSRQ